MCVTTCLKYALWVLNVIIWLLGLSLAAVGIWIRVNPDFWEFQQYVDLKQYYSVTYIVITVGLVLLVIGFFGCCGAATENTTMLITYFVIVLLLVIIELVGIGLAWAWVNNDKLNEALTEEMEKIQSKKEVLDNHQYIMDLLQSKLHCCGVRGPSDYSESTLPPSCMVDDTKKPYQIGCVDKLRQEVKEKADIIGGVSLCIVAMQVAVLVLTMCLVCTVNQPLKLFV